MIDEGYIKFDMRWRNGRPPDSSMVADLNRWRKPLVEAGLIGEYRDLGIAYGNLSRRAGNPGQFIISGTQTGHLRDLQAEHYSLVLDCDIAENRVFCRGRVKASSESMTHAALYALSSSIDAVVHVHSGTLWQKHLDRLPTTRPDAAYGTPDMAREFERLYRQSEFPDIGIAVMAGHEDGIVSIGRDIAEAALRVLELNAGQRPG